MQVININPPPPVMEDAIDNFTDLDLRKMGAFGALIRLGRKLIEHNFHDQWLTMAEVTGFCRRYRIYGLNMHCRELEIFVEHYFAENAEISGGGVKILHVGDWSDEKRRFVYRLSFHRLYPDGTIS